MNIKKIKLLGINLLIFNIFYKLKLNIYVNIVFLNYIMNYKIFNNMNHKIFKIKNRIILNSFSFFSNMNKSKVLNIKCTIIKM